MRARVAPAVTAVALLGLALALTGSLAPAPVALAAVGAPTAAAESPRLAPTTPTPARSPQASPTSPRPPAPTATVTPSATTTPTITPSATALPPTPTTARPTPQPSGYFVSVYQGQTQAPGLERGLIRGRVLDYRGIGIASFPIACRTSGVVYTTSTGGDGSYAVGGLRPGSYTVTISGYPNTPAEGIRLSPGAVVSVDFVEAARPGATPAPGATAMPASADAEELSARNRPSVLVVVLTPEGGPPTDAETRTPTPTLVAALDDAEASADPWPGWLQSFLVGMAVSYGVAVLGLTLASLRR